MTNPTESVPPFLVDLLEARSPTGFEHEAQAVVDRHMGQVGDHYTKDTLGNRACTVNAAGDPTIMLAGHIDELGLLIKHVDDLGFLYFETLGGHDRTIISGRRVVIQTKNGPVFGVTGKRAIHLMSPEDRKKVPELHEIWIDIGANSRDEALERVGFGDVAVYDHGFAMLHGTKAVARAFDDKVGAYIVLETARRLADEPQGLDAKVVSVATTQEEIGTRGAQVASYAADPHFGIAIDVGHATDHPDCDPRKHGKYTLGGGPIISRGPNTNPMAYEKLTQAAEAEEIPLQIEADSRPTGTDARIMQMARSGVATAILHVPLRYMHTPSEVIDLEDVEQCIRLLVRFCRDCKRGDRGDW